jgi:SAM-dependent methyltransferase
MAIAKEQMESTKSNSPYDRAFFDMIAKSSLASAQVIVPMLAGLLQWRSVVDVGCGCGAWLRVFQQHGAQTIVGYDGDYVDPSQLLIPSNSFHSVDLSSKIQIDGRYDLAVCLEVGEHLAAASARPLIATLCEAAPAVLFSAAIPGQGGTHHINEQWPEYWERLFAENDFVRLDPIRRLVFSSQTVAPWYKQNMYLFIARNTLVADSKLTEEYNLAQLQDVDIVLKSRLSRFKYAQGLIRELPIALVRAFRNRLHI